jgi:hypothetical protein
MTGKTTPKKGSPKSQTPPDLLDSLRHLKRQELAPYSGDEPPTMGQTIGSLHMATTGLTEEKWSSFHRAAPDKPHGRNNNRGGSASEASRNHPPTLVVWQWSNGMLFTPSRQLKPARVPLDAGSNPTVQLR